MRRRAVQASLYEALTAAAPGKLLARPKYAVRAGFTRAKAIPCTPEIESEPGRQLRRRVNTERESCNADRKGMWENATATCWQGCSSIRNETAYWGYEICEF